MRAPLAPSGWPIAMAPPLTFVLARSAPVSCAQASVGLRAHSRVHPFASRRHVDYSGLSGEFTEQTAGALQ
jgi:hypothetical protein